MAGGYELAQVIPEADFTRMVALAPVPGSENEAIVVTQGGQMWRVALDGGAPPQMLGDLSGRIGGGGNEEGLLALAFSPDFAADGRAYVYYTQGSPQPSRLSRFQVTDSALDPASERVLLEAPQPFANHNGGQLLFGPDGYLYLSLGDGGSGGDPQGHGQNLSTLLGTVIRLDVSGEDYAVPPDNPFVDTPGARPEIYAYGLRNPWRMSFDRATGDLWLGDVGQNRWEEVNRIEAGGNYGWNVVEGFECFQQAGCDTTGLIFPRAVYPIGGMPECAVTGGYVYRGPSMPELDGWYVYGDFCSGKIWAVNAADPPMADDPVLLADTGLPISSFGELPDGELVVLTFANAIFRLQRSG